MKHGAKRNLLEELKKLPYFSKKRIFQLGSNEKTYDLTKKTVDTYVSRFLKNKEIRALKRGFYVTTDFYEKNKFKTAYLFFLANVLRRPSYVSSWTALQYYGLATEVIQIVTCVTTNITRTYKTEIGAFFYQSIKKELFSDFSLVKDGDFAFSIARPSKALFDLLYFKTRQFRGLTQNDVEFLIDELRIDMSEMEEDERGHFYLLLKKQLSYE